MVQNVKSSEVGNKGKCSAINMLLMPSDQERASWTDSYTKSCPCSTDEGWWGSDRWGGPTLCVQGVSSMRLEQEGSWTGPHLVLLLSLANFPSLTLLTGQGPLGPPCIHPFSLVFLFLSLTTFSYPLFFHSLSSRWVRMMCSMSGLKRWDGATGSISGPHSSHFKTF